MVDLVINKTGIDREKITIEKPKINIVINHYFDLNNMKKPTFFYPAGPMEYKNHKTIVEAIDILCKKNPNINIVFTLSGNENKLIRKLYTYVSKNNLPISFVGELSQEEVYDYYTKSILLFASYIETFGLPMLEARVHKTPIIASDCAFSHEILDNYKDVTFFNPHSTNDLVRAILYVIKVLESEKK